MEDCANTFAETFESTTFQFLNPFECTLADCDGSGYFIGRCDFSGLINGSFDLLIHENAVNEYLNFLFDDDTEMTITDELKSDSIKELSNVICGNMISRCINAQTADYKIEKPQFIALSSLRDLSDPSLYSFFTDSYGKICGFSFQVK